MFSRVVSSCKNSCRLKICLSLIESSILSTVSSWQNTCRCPLTFLGHDIQCNLSASSWWNRCPLKPQDFGEFNNFFLDLQKVPEIIRKHHQTFLQLSWMTYYYTDGDFWRREHHGMFLSRGLKWYWGKIISPETKSRDLYSSRNIISNPKILGTFRDVPDNKVAICYIVWLPIAPIALPGFGIARINLQNSVFFSSGDFL